MRLTLLKKGLLLISVPLVFQLLFILFLNRTISSAIEAERLVLHTKDVLVEAQSAHAHMVRAQSAGRGFVITSNPMFDQEVQDELRRVYANASRLKELTSDNPEQVARAQDIHATMLVLKDWILETTRLVRSGEQQQAVERIKALDGKVRMQNVVAAVDRFVLEEGRLETARLQELRHTRDQQRWIVGGGVFGSTIVTAFVAWLFSRSISQRIAVLTRNAEALAEGQPLAAQLSGGDEIARLDAVMHDTSHRLNDAITSERKLTSEVEKRAAALSSANENLRQQTQENEMFVYSVSHDLRSPLVNLQGFSRELSHAGADLKAMLADERIPPDVRQRVDRVIQSDVMDSIRFIQSAVTRSAAIIDALLRLSRAGRVEYRMQMVDVPSVISRIVDAMANTIEAKKATVTLGKLPTCWGDATAVEQVFGNLIGNAVNYLDPTRPGQIEVGLAHDSRAVRDGMNTYYVLDNGLGIPAAYLGKVFVAFQRLHGDIAKGEGIGLALVRRVVERHNGEIWVESTEGVGTTFFVALPAAEPRKVE